MMKKASDGTDIQEWEFIPVDDHGDHYEGKVLVPNVVFDFTYITCPCPSPICSSDNVTKGIDQLVPIPIQLEKNDPDEIINVPVLDIKVPKLLDHELISPALFEEKPQENHQLVDIKMDLIKSDDDRGINPEADMEQKTTCSVVVADHQEIGNQKKNNYLDQNIRKWRRKVNGIGVICSIGVAAAATVCIFIFGSKRGEHNKSYRSNQQFRFQIYTEDKRIKQVVHHATRLNQAISAVVSGVPGNRACITLGGYYDAGFEVTPDFIL